jgi:capsular polysaccharide export protein
MPPTERRRGYHFNAGFLTNRRVRRILHLSGYDLKLGKPRPGDDVLVWGHSPYAPRGEAVARATGARLIRVEDAALRSLRPGRAGDPPLGLVIDRQGIYFDATAPSDLETILARDPLDDPCLLSRATGAIARIRAAHLSKYSATDPDVAPPAPGYVLLIDQTRGDASIRFGLASDDSFARMLAAARADHPDTPIVIKTHPETQAGHRPGHFTPAALPDGVTLEERPISPWRLFDGAKAVYCVTSQLGFEAILAGHRPICFGVPFYAGWGLTDDRGPVPDRRGRPLTAAQLAAAALIRYPTWYDPYRDRVGTLEDVLGTLEAQSRAWRDDRHGYAALGMRSWKRGHLGAIFGGKISFHDTEQAALAEGKPVMVWAGKETEPLRAACAKADKPLLRIEDGFLRSRGLGAELVPPLSLVRDDLGIYYDPTRESRLERLIAAAATMPPERLARAARLIERIAQGGVTKYNLGSDSPLPDLPKDRPVVLVPGQVEDDASIRLGAGSVARNDALLQTARRLHPDAVLIYKPHPDVVAGLRQGAVTQGDLADHILPDIDAARLLGPVDRVVTITSALGFEALLRGVAVTTLGAPFYAGWGLTTDLGQPPARRVARPSLPALAHAALIAYPRYHDPLTGQPCPPEVALDRLISGDGLRQPPRLRALAKLQGWFAGQAWLWRGR